MAVTQRDPFHGCRCEWPRTCTLVGWWIQQSSSSQPISMAKTGFRYFRQIFVQSKFEWKQLYVCQHQRHGWFAAKNLFPRCWRLIFVLFHLFQLDFKVVALFLAKSRMRRWVVSAKKVLCGRKSYSHYTYIAIVWIPKWSLHMQWTKGSQSIRKCRIEIASHHWCRKELGQINR